MPLQWRNQFWQSLEEGAGKQCLECVVVQYHCLLTHALLFPAVTTASQWVSLLLFKTNTHFPVPSFLDFNTLPDILGALPDIWLKGEEIHRRCACKLYYFTRCSFGGVIAGEPDVMGTCFIHKVETFSEFAISKNIDDNLLTQSLSAEGLVHEMKLKSRLPPFFLISIRCHYCFWFHGLPLLSKCC